MKIIFFLVLAIIVGFNPIFADNEQAGIKNVKILSHDGNDTYVYLIQVCAANKRVLEYDIILSTDLYENKFQYHEPLRTNSCIDYRIGFYAKDPNTVTAELVNVQYQEISTNFDFISIFTDKEAYHDTDTIKIHGFITNPIPEQRIQIDIEGALTNTMASKDGEFTTEIFSGQDRTPYSVVTVVTEGKIFVTNLKTTFEKNQEKDIGTIEQEPIQSNKSSLESELQELIKKYKRDHSVTSFNNLYQTWNGNLPENIGSSEISGMCCFTVIWFNDDKGGNTVTSTKGVFDSGELKLGDSFSYKFDKPGLYPYYSKLYPQIKHAVRVHNPATDCSVDGCGDPTQPTWCESFGTMKDGKCVNEDELNQAIQKEFERRANILEGRKQDAITKEQQMQEIQKQLDAYYAEIQKLGNSRYDMEESEYTRQLDEIHSKMEPLEIKYNRLNDEVNDLYQDQYVRFECHKSQEKFFECTTETRTGYVDFLSETSSVKRIANKLDNQPEWFKKTLRWHDEGLLSDKEMLQLIKWMIKNEIIN